MMRPFGFLPVLIALVALLPVASDAHAAGTDRPAAASASLAKKVAAAERRLRVIRRKRTTACHREAANRCRALKRAHRRQSRRVTRLRRALRHAAGPGSAAPRVVGATGAPAPANPTASLYVASGGSDAATGTAAHPLATLTEALRRADGGQVIAVGPGSYPRATDQKARTRTVWVIGPGDGSAVVDGMSIDGGQELEIRGLRFKNLVSVRYHASLGLAQPARNVAFRSSDFTAPAGQGCLTARNGVSGFAVTDSYVHDCTTGFGAGAGGAIPQSSGLTIADNRLARFSSDAIQFGQWNDVRITGNTITGIRDPGPCGAAPLRECIHNDGIQLTGNSHGVAISRNRISDARTQLIFIQDAVGPIDDVMVNDNLVYGAGAVAIQSQGATNARFVHNTAWRADGGGLWLTQGYTRNGVAVVPRDSVVVNNVLTTYRRLGGAWTRSSAGNAILPRPGERPMTNASEGWTSFTDMGFTDAAHDDYRLRPDSPVRGVGSTLVTTAADLDLLARSMPPVPGALR